MRRQIKIKNEQFEVIAYHRSGSCKLQVGEGKAEAAILKKDGSGNYTIQFGDRIESIEMAVKGETAYIKAFDQTFTLQVLDPIEQAQQTSGGRGGTTLAPMPGTIVEIHVQPGDKVVRGQPLMTIESMKILTVIKASRDGEVENVHLKTGQTFDKNAVLVTLTEEGDK